MGLSDEERIEGICYSIRAITKLGKELEEQQSRSYGFHDYEELCRLIKRLWPAAVGSESNGMHWIMGSSASNTVSWETNTPWGVAIKSHIEAGARELSRDGDDFFDPDRDKEFDPFDGFLSIGGLLPAPHNKVYDIYGWIEQLIYYLRRYKDQFAKNLSGLSDLVARIQGECFAMFTSEDIYGKAYLLNKIAEAVYIRFQQDEDVVKKWFKKQNMHHDISLPMSEPYRFPMKDLVRIHLRIVKARVQYKKKGKKRAYDMCRILTTLELSDRRYQYDHQHRELLKMLQEDGWAKKRIKKIEKALQKCKESKEKYDQDQRKSFDSDGDEIFYDWMCK